MTVRRRTKAEVRAQRRAAEEAAARAPMDERGFLVIIDEAAAKNRAVAIAARIHAAMDKGSPVKAKVIRRDLDAWYERCDDAARAAVRRGLRAVFGAADMVRQARAAGVLVTDVGR